jgi:hypothetical protein
MSLENRFYVNISHDSGECEATLSDGGMIHYKSTHNGDAMPTPSAEEWTRFADSCRRIGVDKWASMYEDEEGNIIETYWTIDFNVDGLSYSGKGDNAIPENFDSFTAAVSNLLGGLEFA